MANIHAINAQGTEYGITAENGITQAQADAIATIGDVSDLTTETKTDVVSAINEVNEKLSNETVVYENQSPTEGQGSLSMSVSGLTNAKALKITHGMCSAQYGILKEEVFPLRQNGFNNFYLSAAQIDDDGETMEIQTRRVTLNAVRTSIDIAVGKNCIYDIENQSVSTATSNSAEKVLKIVALF